jgi:hypothetical protein
LGDSERIVAMKSPSAMPEIRPSHDSPRDHAQRCISIRDSVLVGLVLLTLVPREALAGDPAPTTGALDTGVNNFRHFSPPATAPMAHTPSMADTPTTGLFTSPTAGDNPLFSATDFRPRKHTVFDSDPTVNSFADTPMLRSTTIWQRMSEYKSHDRVRLLTLWESSGSTVSLQAGKHGDPSLQWTSRVLNRGGSTQGLLDRFFSVSLAHASSGLRAGAPPTKTALPRGTSTGKVPPSGPSK